MLGISKEETIHAARQSGDFAGVCISKISLLEIYAEIPTLASRIFLLLDRPDVLGMQVLHGWDDQAFDLHLRLAFGQALGVGRLVLLCIYHWSAVFHPVPARHADPAVWVAGRDEHLVLLAACKFDMNWKRGLVRS